jgi:electron transfer flavoprotein alpha subunit
MTTLLLAKHDNHIVNNATSHSAALGIGSPVYVLVAGSGCRGVAEATAKLDGVAKVLLADDPIYKHRLPEPLAPIILSIAGSYEHIVAPGTTTGKNVMPGVAADLDVMQVSDITKVVAPDTFERPIYAGNAIKTVQATDAQKVITVRTALFPATPQGQRSVPIEEIPAAADPDLSRFSGEELSKSERPELASAKVIISGGRGLGSSDNFKKLLEPIADRLGAAIGASRAAVDAGYATTFRSASPARSSPPIFTSRSVCPARSNMWPA